MRDSVEIINMKCHDIKRQLSSLQGKLTENEIAALQEAVKIYDGKIKTGNEILDTILYQKSLYCEKHDIRLTCLADGSLLSFITPSELYALLSNAIENAIEAVINLDPSKRIISLSVGRSETCDITIEVSNYFDERKVVTNGTSKEDKVHHGYGIKSMRYIAEQYGGVLNTEKQGEIFSLTIKFPHKKIDERKES